MHYVIFVCLLIGGIIGYTYHYKQVTPTMLTQKQTIAALEVEAESLRQQRNAAIGREIMWKTIYDRHQRGKK